MYVFSWNWFWGSIKPYIPTPRAILQVVYLRLISDTPDGHGRHVRVGAAVPLHQQHGVRPLGGGHGLTLAPGQRVHVELEAAVGDVGVVVVGLVLLELAAAGHDLGGEKKKCGQGRLLHFCYS